MILHDMSGEIALDFTEQLMVFEKCGNVYARDEFVQAREVSYHFLFLFIEHWMRMIRQCWT